MLYIRFYCLVIATFLCAWNTNGQSPYDYHLLQECTILATGLGAGSVGVYYRANTEGLTSQQLQQLDPLSIRKWERSAIDNDSPLARRWSDALAYGSHLAPLTLWAGADIRRDRWQVPLLWLEGYIVNAGLTGLIKYTVRRSRPYVFNDAVSLELRQARDARTAFVSGHTSISAYNSFFTAQVFSDYYPDSPLKPLIWVGAATIPALTAIGRVKGGQHYLADVIAGYVLGALTGIVVPQLHRIKKNR